MALRSRGIWAFLIGATCVTAAPQGMAFTADPSRRTDPGPIDHLYVPIAPATPELPSRNISRDQTAELPHYLGAPGTAAVAVARPPDTGRVASSDPGPEAAGLDAMDLTPTARGGGPPPNPTGTPTGTLVNLPVALPIGCTRLSVVGTPDARNVTARLVGGSGEATRFEQRSQRLAVGVACVREAGTYQVQVSMRGPRRALLDAEVFTSRDPSVSEPPIRLR